MSLHFGRVGQLVLVVAILAFGKPVLLPIALAFYFAFVLTPPSQALERLGLPRALSVAVIVVVVVAALVVLTGALASQVADLATQTQAYSVRMSQKLELLHQGQVGLLGGFDEALARLSRSLEPNHPHAAAPVRVVTEDLSFFERLDDTLRPLLQPVALVGIVLVLTIFVLSKRDDLRGRLIQLVGTRNITVTTQTIDEVAARISRFLLTQAYINTAFGVVISAGLYVIGIPYALLWGALAGVLRFVPFIGALISLVLPSLVAFAVFPGWGATIATVSLFVIADLSVAHFIEPVLLGRRTGVSALALVMSALFWTWLWGPLGLLLSTPITVCAAAMGRHLPRLGFLTVLLGDEPALTADVNFYQRILAGAVNDAYRIAKRRAGEASIAVAFDEVIVGALRLMMRDQDGETIGATEAGRAVKDIGDVVTRVSLAAPRAPDVLTTKCIGIPAESATDALLLRMLGVVSPCALSALPVLERSAAVDAAIAGKPDVIYISAVPPGSVVNARFLCRRLRAALPSTRIIVWLSAVETDHGVFEAAARLREAGATRVAFTLADAAKSDA